MRDVRQTIASCLRLSIDKGATEGERVAARRMAEKLSSLHSVSLDSVRGPSSADFVDAIRRWANTHKAKECDRGPEATAVGTIQDYCFQVLGRDLGGLGYSYEDILRWVAGRFPKSRTTINSLRWYETRMRKSGLHVPKRKRKPSNR